MGRETARSAPREVYVPQTGPFGGCGDIMAKTRDAKATDTSLANGVRGGRAPRRLLLIALVSLGLIALLAVGFRLAWTALERPLTVTPDRTELQALDRRLTDIRNAIKPIATAFASEPATGLIDVGSYRTRIAAVGRLVDSTNDLSVTSPEAIEVRDLIITGGSQVLAGMDSALDALQTDDASATAPASEQVDEGLASLQDAHDKLNALLGTKSRT
jgi:hypothetical protein